MEQEFFAKALRATVNTDRVSELRSDHVASRLSHISTTAHMASSSPETNPTTPPEVIAKRRAENRILRKSWVCKKVDILDQARVFRAYELGVSHINFIDINLDFIEPEDFLL